MTSEELADRLAIHELIALYGHVIDEAEWDRLGELFTADLVFDTSAFPDGGVVKGLAPLQARWSAPAMRHPLAHHATNIVITTLAGDRAEVVSKGIGVGRAGRVGSVTYRDVLRHEAAGWRIAHRIARLRNA